LTTTTEQIGYRIDRLIEKGHAVRRDDYEWGGGEEFEPDKLIDPAALSAWEVQTRVALTAILGADHEYTLALIGYQGSGLRQWHRINYQLEILGALREDLDSGDLFQRLGALLTADVFSDFLEMAEHLAEQGYKDPAASLAGAVLEDGLRKIAIAHDVPVKSANDIAALNTRLVQKGIYNNLRRKQVDGWTFVRNKADHAEFDEYTADDVAGMIAGVRGFLGEQL
jgi:hypothetical protein